VFHVTGWISKHLGEAIILRGGSDESHRDLFFLPPEAEVHYALESDITPNELFSFTTISVPSSGK